MKLTLERLLVIALCAAIGWFYVWTVRSNNEEWTFEREQNDYYNLLIDGWLDGQLHMKVPVPEALLQLKDPYDPAVRPPGLGLHDASFYRGKYYVYFGAAPVAVLMLPFRVLTGVDLPLAAAVLTFAFAGFLAMAALWLDVRRRYFPETGAAVVMIAVPTLGLANLGPVLVRRPHMWELPIGAGFCFAMLALLAVWRSLHAAEARERRAWFGAAGLGLGLAIASRPTYLLASPLLAVPLLFWWRGSRGGPWGPLAWAVVPLALIGAGMAWHNHARFGDAFQFGQAYQFSLDYESKIQHFSARYAEFNGWRYFFSGAEWSRYFPFIAPAELPPKPRGFGGHDDVYGIFANLPFAWLAFAAPLALRGRAQRGPLLAWMIAAAVLFVVMTGVLLGFFGSLARYQLDFTPVLILLAGVGTLAVERALRRTPSRTARVGGRALWGAAALGSALFGVLFSLQLNGRLRDHDPAAFRAAAALGNRLPAAFERWSGEQHGPLELGLRLAPAAETRRLLASVGRPTAVDRVFVRQLADGRVQFETESVHGVSRSTPPVAVDFARPHALRITMGSLLPPETHPRALTLPPEAFAALARRLRIEFDGVTLLEVSPWFSAPPGPVTVGAEAREIVTAVRRDGAGWDQAGPAGRRHAIVGSGTVNMRVRLPRDRPGAREPLVVAGRPGRGDFVCIEYLDADTVRFGFDHWGGAGQWSEPVPVAYDRAIELRISLESLRAPGPLTAGKTVLPGRLGIAVDGRMAWQIPAEFFNVPPEEIVVADNLIGGTSCGPVFTGEVLAVERARRN